MSRPVPALTVRPASDEDAGPIERVLRASYPVLLRTHYDPGLLNRASPFLTRADLKLIGSGRFYVAEIERIVFACGGWSLHKPGTDEVTEGLAYIRHFATHADFVRQGLGRTLYNHCEAAARREGVRDFECMASLYGEAFYAALGFARVEDVEVTFEPRLAFPGVRMRRCLLS